MMRIPLLLLSLTACAVDEPATKLTEPAARPPAGSTVVLAGTRSLVVQTTPDMGHCGGLAVAVHQTAASDDLEPELVAAMTIEFPRGLDFASDTAGARARVDAFLRDAAAKAERASALYRRRADDHSASPAVRIAAVARQVQILRRLGDELAHAELPRDATAGDHATDKANAYCDALAKAAEPLLHKAELAAAECRGHMVGSGWWASACAAR